MSALKPTQPAKPAAAKRVFRNALLMLTQQVFVTAATLVVAGFVARHLGREKYGQYEYSFSMVAGFSVLATMGLRAVTVRSVAQLKGGLQRYLGMMFSLRVSLALLVVPLVLMTSASLGDSARVWLTVAIAALTLPLHALSTLVRDVFQGMEEMDVEAATLVSVRLFTMLGALSAVALGGGVVAIVSVYALGSLVGLIVPLRALRRRGIALRPHLDGRAAFQQLRQGVPFAGSAAAALFLWEINPVLLGKLSTLSMVGVYAAGTRMVGPLEMIPDSIGTALAPAVARGFASDDAATEPLLQRSFFYLALLGLPVGVGGVLVAEPLVQLIFGDDYAGAAQVLQFAVAVIPLEFITIASMYVLGAIHRQNEVFWLTVAAALLNVMMCALLIPRHGALGCAWAIAAVSVFSFFVGQWLLHRHYAVWAQAGRYLRLVLAAGSMAAVVWGLSTQLLVITLLAGALSYAAALLLLRVVTIAELRAVLRGALPWRDADREASE